MEAAVARIVDGKYRLDRLIGEGAIGIVYEALHVGLQKRFAIKMLKAWKDPESSAVQRFRREAEALGRLKHPHIVDVTDFGVEPEEGRPYLVMEYLDGVTLAERCSRSGEPLALERALQILEAVSSAIDHAHENGILHRDLKPANVILSRDSSGQPAPKVLDFGLAAWIDEPESLGDAEAAATDGPARHAAQLEAARTARLTETGSLVGTLTYVAPELIRSPQATTASDVYSFGVLAYEVLVGRPPFQGTAGEVVAGHLGGVPPDPAQVGRPLPPEVAAALHTPLAKDPALRPVRAADVVRALRRGQAVDDRRRWRAAEVPRRLALAAALALAALGASAAVERSPAGRALERWLVDARFAGAPRRAPDPRILVVTVDESSLVSNPVPLTERADEFGRDLQRVYDAGARAVAIDFLLPARWSASKPFSDLVLRHADTLTLASMAPLGADLVGPECVSGLTAVALGRERVSALFGLVNLEEDPDGVVRHARLAYATQAAGQLPSWPAWAARNLLRPDAEGREASALTSVFWIDHTVDWERFQRIRWREVPGSLDENPGLFRDRLVLVGGDFAASGDDSHRAPSDQRVSGVVLQAMIVNTILAGQPVQEKGSIVLSCLGVLTAAAALAGLLCRPSAATPLLWTAAAIASYVSFAFLSFRQMGIILPLTGPLSTVALGIAAGLAVRARLPRVPAEERSPQ